MKSFLITIILYCSSLLISYAQVCQSNHIQAKRSMAGSLDPRSDTTDILKYTINLAITDFVGKIIRGNTVVRFTPKITGVSSLNLDLLKMTIDSIKAGNNILSYTYNDTLVSIILGKSYSIYDTADIHIYYHGVPQGDVTGWGGFYFQSDYAFNLGVGFGANPHVYGRVWFPCFDNFSERSVFEFNITTNQGKIAICNGELMKDSLAINGNRTRTWILNDQIPTYLASVAAGKFAEIHQTYTGIENMIPIMLAAPAVDTTKVKQSFAKLNTALSVFENHFGPYKWIRVGYSMIPFSNGAMEHATNIAYPRSFANGTLNFENIYVHELSHHWFGNLATCSSQEDMWLNEGWASYCESIFDEAAYGRERYMSNIRVNHEDLLHFLHYREGYLSLDNIPFEYTYGDHVYKKGAVIAHSLRGYLGDDLFFSSMKSFLEQYAMKSASSSDLMNSLTATSGVDMSHFFTNWVHNPGWPHFSIDSFQTSGSPGNYQATVFVKQKLSGAPEYFTNVPLELTFRSKDHNELIKTILMSGELKSFTMSVSFQPEFVAINMSEKISHAVAPAYKMIKVPGTYNFENARMILNVSSVTDSAFVRIEHNYVHADPEKTCCRFRISPQRYWKVDGIIPDDFSTSATIVYNGNTFTPASNYYLDNLLNITNEDSLLLVYRKNAGDEWNVYPYYTKNDGGNKTDKSGKVTIHSLQKGEYSFAIGDPALVGIHTNNEGIRDAIILYPNPASSSVLVRLDGHTFLRKNSPLLLQVVDISGKVILETSFDSQNQRFDIGNFLSGNYTVIIKEDDTILASEKLLVRK